MANMRLFFALTLDQKARDGLASLLRQLQLACRDAAHVGWVPPESLHATMKFVGDWPQQRLTDLTEAGQMTVAGLEAFQFSVCSLGCFPKPPARPRIIWAGLSEPAGTMRKLAERLEQLCRERGVRRENRPFSAHLTLGRVKRVSEQAAILRQLEAHDGFGPIPQWAQELTLFSSLLSRQGAR